MSEAQPAKKVGGHTYGRRNLELSNTAEEGELCLYAGHSIGRFSATSMGYYVPPFKSAIITPQLAKG